MAFTNDEVQLLVDALLGTSVEVPRSITGTRDVVAARNLAFDLLSAAFLLSPHSFFALVQLGRNRIAAELNAELIALDQFLEAADALETPRATTKIESTTDLVRAEAALLELNGVVNATIRYGKASSIPAVKRFRDSVTSFAATELAKNVVDGNELVPTPDELRMTLRNAWTQATQKRALNDAGIARYASVITDFSDIKFPAQVLQRLVSKTQDRLSAIRDTMESDKAIEQSRSALLELMTMRALLTTASTFQVPKRVLYSGAATLLDSSGNPPELTATILGEPFMHDLESFELDVDGGGPISVTFPHTARAELRSAELTAFPLALTGTVMALDFNTTSGNVVLAVNPASGPAAATYLDGIWSGFGVNVTWDAGTSQLVFQDAANDASYLRVRRDTTPQQNFCDLVFAGQPLEGRAQHTTIEEIRAAVATSLTAVSVEQVGAGEFGWFNGVVISDQVLARKLDGTLDVDANGVWTGPFVFTDLGIKAGDILFAGALNYVVTSAGRSQLVTTPAPAPGSYAVGVGSDLSAIPTGSTVVLPGMDQLSGIYRVVGYGTESYALYLDRFGYQGAASFAIYDRRIKFVATSVSTTATLATGNAGSGLAKIGHVETTAYAELTVLELGQDAAALGVLIDDQVTLTDTEGSEVRTVASVSGTRITLSAPVRMSGSPPNTAEWLSVVIERPAYITYDESLSGNLLAPGLNNISDSATADELDLIVTRMLHGARFSTAFRTTMEAHRDFVQAQYDSVMVFSAPEQQGINQIVQMLREQGMDRALDVLLDLSFSDFFALGTDDVSYGTRLVRKSAETMRGLIQGTRGTKSAQGIVGLASKVRGYDPWQNP